MNYRKPLLFFISLLFLLSACAKNPVTKGNDFVLMSENEELDLGKQYAPVFTKQFGGVYKDKEIQEYVNKIGQSLADHSERSELFYRFTVLDSPIVNAFALPGGYIFVTRGLLAAVNSETELAGVLGHEIAHVTARHSVAQYTKSKSYSILMTTASIFVPGAGNFSPLTDLFAIGILQGYSRHHEMQSDELAVKYLKKSNYDPNGMSSFLNTLRVTEEGKEKGETFEGFFSSHPDTKKRIKKAKELAEETGYQEDPVISRKLQEIYFSKIDGLPFGESNKEGFFLGNRFVHPKMKLEITFPENWHYENTPKKVIAKNHSGKKPREGDEKGKKKSTKVKKATLFTTFSVRERNKRSPLKPYIKGMLEKARVKIEKGWSERIDGLEAYIVIYKGNNKGIKNKKNMTAFIANGPEIYLLTSFASSKDFHENYKLFKNFYRSLKVMSVAEAEKVKPPHIQIYEVKEGDTFEGLAGKFYGNSKKAKIVSQINGMLPDDKLVPGQKIKVIRINESLAKQAKDRK